MTTTHVIEYIAVQIAYSKVNIKWSFSRLSYPLKNWILGLLAQMDFYSDIAMASEIYKCTMVKDHSEKYLVIFLVSLITAIQQFQIIKFKIFNLENLENYNKL